jgi:hypothetical protein
MFTGVKKARVLLTELIKLCVAVKNGQYLIQANNTVAVSQGNAAAQTFTAIGASSVRVENERYANHNGWARIAVADYPSATPITLQIVARAAP